MDKSLRQEVEKSLEEMDPISLQEMDHVRLMKRRDVKYVIPSKAVPELIRKVADKYRVLEIDGEKIQDYQTLYFDTPDREMYHEHHNRRLNRYKVRVRRYVNTDLSFLEIKFKNNKGETIKRRIQPRDPANILENRNDIFLLENSPYSASQIIPALQNHFKRITLVHKTNAERLTIDLDINYSRIGDYDNLRLPGFSVVEIKRDRDSSPSDMIMQLKRDHYQDMGFSKYCMGTALMHPHVKHNLFQSRLRRLRRYDPAFYNPTKTTTN